MLRWSDGDCEGECPDPGPGRAYARQFTPVAAAAEYAGAYRQLLAGRAIFGGPSGAALKPTSPENLCFVERTALLNEMAPTETATSDSCEVPYRAAGPLPEGSASASSAGDLHGHLRGLRRPGRQLGGRLRE